MKNQPFAPTHPMKRMIDNLILDMVITDMQPLSFVENKGLRTLMRAVEKRYPMVSLQTLTGSLLPKRYLERKEMLILI